jgi:hypothetical protein
MFHIIVSTKSVFKILIGKGRGAAAGNPPSPQVHAWLLGKSYNYLHEITSYDVSAPVETYSMLRLVTG